MLGFKLMQQMAKGIKGILIGPTQITTSTASTATAYSNQRKVDRTSNGVLWAVYWDGAAAAWYATYSTDEGATWTKISMFGNAGASYTANGSFFIDVDDNAHFVYKNRSDGYIYYRRGTPNASRTAWTWSAATTIATWTNADYPDVVAHREGTGWVAHIVGGRSSDFASKAFYYPVTISSSGTLAVGSLVQLVDATYGNANHSYPSIDFNHTGDGKTVKDGTPHLYVAWSAGATGAGKGIRFKKATYSGGSWTWGTEREIDNTEFVGSGASQTLSCVFDGTRVMIGVYSQDALGAWRVQLYERDAADTATVQRLDDQSTPYGYLSITYDSAGNVYLIGAGNSNAVGYHKWDRATASLSGFTSVGSGASAPYVSAKRGYSGNRVEFVYTGGTASPYSITYGGIK